MYIHIYLNITKKHHKSRKSYKLLQNNSQVKLYQFINAYFSLMPKIMITKNIIYIIENMH